MVINSVRVLRGLPHLQACDQPPLFEEACTELKFGDPVQRQPHVGCFPRRAVPFHHVTWRTTGSAVSDPAVIVEAMAWLAGGNDRVAEERSTSYHGSPLWLVTATLRSKRTTVATLARLGADNLRTLMEERTLRTDEHNVLHLRLDLHELVAGQAVLAKPSDVPTVKGQAKLALYPGQDPEEEWEKALEQALKAAEEMV